MSPLVPLRPLACKYDGIGDKHVEFTGKLLGATLTSHSAEQNTKSWVPFEDSKPQDLTTISSSSGPLKKGSGHKPKTPLRRVFGENFQRKSCGRTFLDIGTVQETF